MDEARFPIVVRDVTGRRQAVGDENDEVRSGQSDIMYVIGEGLGQEGRRALLPR